MKSNKIIMSILTLVLLFSCILPVTAFADSVSSSAKFSDVPEKHWANNAISWMIENKIVEGDGDGNFKPDRAVARDEFAKMMVLTLKLDLIEPESATFMDVKKGSLLFKYVETAKQYLTVYKTENGSLYYHPTEAALREDMAVALVKALGMTGETADLKVLDTYSDSDSISPKLKKYVAIAVKNKIMSGSTNADGKKVFEPQQTLTRAESAVLLYNAFKQTEEKTTFDEEKDVYEGEIDTLPVDSNGQYTVPEVRAEIDGNKIVVRWKSTTNKNFSYYKVVVSKSNSHPKYSEDGYYEAIKDINKTYSYLQSGAGYNGGDFGGKLKAGEYYYFSVTTVYGDKKVAGNAVRLKMPGNIEVNQNDGSFTPVVKASVVDNQVIMEWNKGIDNNFIYYKVVVSKDNEYPVYPDDGYFEYITDLGKTRSVLKAGDSYNGGDFGGELKSGEYYYFSITSVYGDKKIAGNAIKLKMP